MAPFRLIGAAALYLILFAAPVSGLSGSTDCKSSVASQSGESPAVCRPNDHPRGLAAQALGRDGCGSEDCHGEHVTLLQRAAGSKPPAAVSSRKAGRARPRAVFFAGLEGSGHHFLFGILGEFTGQFPGKVVEFTGQFPGEGARLMPGIDCGHQSYDSLHFEWLRAKMMALEPGKVYLMPVGMSYPVCGDSDEDELREKILHPHLSFIAKAAEQADVDLQVVFMYRPIIESLIAGCVHRHFNSCEEYAKILVSNAGFLSRQLQRTDTTATKVHCFRFGNKTSMAAALDAAGGAGIHTQELIRERFYSEPYDEKTEKKADSAEDHLSKVAIQQLDQADVALQQICQDHE